MVQEEQAVQTGEPLPHRKSIFRLNWNAIKIKKTHKKTPHLSYIRNRCPRPKPYDGISVMTFSLSVTLVHYLQCQHYSNECHCKDCSSTTQKRTKAYVWCMCALLTSYLLFQLMAVAAQPSSLSLPAWSTARTHAPTAGPGRYDHQRRSLSGLTCH